MLPFSLMLLNLHGQHRDYTFGRPGSVCHFSYLCYAPNGNYYSQARPTILVLGQENDSLLKIFKNDTLVNIPDFQNYLFVYIPNRGGSSSEKLNCIPGLASLVTYNYSYGYKNVFLVINDPSITKSDIEDSRLNYLFHNIKLSETKADISEYQIDSSQAITNLFKETIYQVGENSKKEGDDLATYYVEQDEFDEEPAFEKPKKIYFGPPKTFNFTISGMVKEKSNGEVLPFATVVVKGTTNGSVTNANGFFTLNKVPNDTCTLVINYVGYEPVEYFLSPFINKKSLVIEMRSSSISLKGVTITGRKSDVVLQTREDVGIVKMTPKKLEQLPNLGERDVMRSFQLMPGVSAANESSSGLYVRGGTPDQNLVLFDGFTVYHVDHLYGFFSAFNANAVKDVQLYKGGFESKFGGRLSSVTEITSKDGNQRKFNVGGDVSLLSFNVFAEVPIKDKFTSIVTFRRSYKGFLYNKIFDAFNSSSEETSENQTNPMGRQMEEAEATSYFYDLNGKFTYHPDDKNNFTLSFFNGTDKLDNSREMNMPSFGSSNKAMNMTTTDLTDYGNIGSSFKWSRKISEKLFVNSVASYSNFYSDRDRSQSRISIKDEDTTTTNQGVFENNDLRDYSLKSDFQYNMASWVSLEFGAYGTYFDIDYTYAQNDTSYIINKQNESLLGGIYLQAKIKPFKDKIQLVPGLRSSYYLMTNKLYHEPRLAASYKLSKLITLKASTGKYYQFANKITREDIMSGSKEFWILSDGDKIPVSSAIHYNAGISFENDNYLFSTDLYYKTIDNLTEYSLRFNSNPMEVSYDENFYVGKGTARGVEFLFQKKIGKLNGWMSYTLGEANNFFDVYSDVYYSANQDVTHEFKIIGLYNYKRWNFSATWIFATGRPYTAPSGAYTITLLDGTEQEFYTVTAKNGVRLPDYHRMDISVNYKLLGGRKEDRKRKEIGNLGFSIFNVYNRTNVWYKEFAIEDGEIIETNVNYMGFTPNLSLSLKLR